MPSKSPPQDMRPNMYSMQAQEETSPQHTKREPARTGTQRKGAHARYEGQHGERTAGGTDKAHTQRRVHPWPPPQVGSPVSTVHGLVVGADACPGLGGVTLCGFRQMPSRTCKVHNQRNRFPLLSTAERTCKHRNQGGAAWSMKGSPGLPCRRFVREYGAVPLAPAQTATVCVGILHTGNSTSCKWKLKQTEAGGKSWCIPAGAWRLASKTWVSEQGGLAASLLPAHAPQQQTPRHNRLWGRQSAAGASLAFAVGAEQTGRQSGPGAHLSLTRTRKQPTGRATHARHASAVQVRTKSWLGKGHARSSMQPTCGKGRLTLPAMLLDCATTYKPTT
jgi:hypothetical protein